MIENWADDETILTDAFSNVSIFIITKNEEVNIARCLDSVRWSNDVVILDALSSDRTVALAASYPNVRLFSRPFTNYSDQRNYGLHSIRYRNNWVLVVDADEVVELALADEVRAIARFQPPPDAAVAYSVRRIPCLHGTLLRRNLSASFWITRLVRPQWVSYCGLVHERVMAAGTVGKLKSVLQHHQFAKGIDDWMVRRMLYARLESLPMNASCRPPVSWGDLFRADTERRHLALKALFLCLPARWLIYFGYNLVVKWAFLDGRVGLKFVFLETVSQFRAMRQICE